MKTVKAMIMCLLFLTMSNGCAYRYYLGMHGPSVRNYPDIHQGVVEDAACLRCHDPNNQPSGPPTTHPQFTGCLKCHNDPLT